jgi:hypothetical protein
MVWDVLWGHFSTSCARQCGMLASLTYEFLLVCSNYCGALSTKHTSESLSAYVLFENNPQIKHVPLRTYVYVPLRTYVYSGNTRGGKMGRPTNSRSFFFIVGTYSTG